MLTFSERHSPDPERRIVVSSDVHLGEIRGEKFCPYAGREFTQYELQEIVNTMEWSRFNAWLDKVFPKRRAIGEFVPGALEGLANQLHADLRDAAFKERG